MNRLLSFVLSAGISMAAVADRVMPGIWMTKKLADGTEVRVELKGDERMCYWQGADGTRYVERSGVLRPVSDLQMDSLMQSRRARMINHYQAEAQSRRMASRASSDDGGLRGRKKGLIILVEFSDLRFAQQSPLQYFNRMANEKGFDNGYNVGSISDYFRDQSAGLFEMDFDVVGPVRMSKGYAYYGADSDNSIDDNFGYLLVEAIDKADSQVNWRDYDWDGDGEVEQIFFLYAGKGQATGGGANTIWPHQFDLRGWTNLGITTVVKDGVRINGYACSNEVDYYGRTTGIGTFCHEFSHCLGLPDIYDTSANDGNSKANYGMDSWDIMDRGNHNNGGNTPCGYTCWEKAVLGWIEPIELTSDVMVTGLKPVSDGGDSYYIENPGNENEYYIMENRMKKGWDRFIDGSGLQIIHVDYDPEVFFRYNSVNTNEDGINDHQRLTIFHADNKASNADNSGDLYPYGGMNVLSNYSLPAARLYNDNTDGKKYMNIRISRMARETNGDVSFLFGNLCKADRSVIFAEQFDDCNSSGGNDNVWGGTAVTSIGTLRADNEGWTAEYMRGGRYCGRFGYLTPTDVRSPAISFTGDCKLTLRMAPFVQEGTMEVKLSTDNPDVTLVNNTVTLSPKKWTEFSTDVRGKGSASIIFSPDCRLYIDDMVVRNNAITGIEDVLSAPAAHDTAVYDMQGRRVGQGNAHGIFIVGGKKIVR